MLRRETKDENGSYDRRIYNEEDVDPGLHIQQY